MPRVLIAGCGYVGRTTAQLFRQKGWEVEAWTATAESAEALIVAGTSALALDLGDGDAVLRAASAADVVIHSASSGGGGADAYRRIYLEGARNLIAGFPNSRLLFTSSTSVYAQTSGEWVTEASEASPQRETGRILRETEETVLAAGGTVARLAGIYGPGRSALLRKFLAGTAVLDSASSRWTNQVHRDDIAAALLFLADRSSGPLDIYNVSDHHPISQRDCYTWLAAKLQRPLPPEVDSAPERKRGNSNKRVSSDKLQALGWAPRYPTFASAMTESILPELDREGA